MPRRNADFKEVQYNHGGAILTFRVALLALCITVVIFDALGLGGECK